MTYITRNGLEIIRIFYNEIVGSSNKDLGECFNNWFTHFELVHGPLERKREVDRKYLASLYNLDSKSLSLPHLLFAIETYFSCWMKFKAYILLSNVNDFQVVTNSIRQLLNHISSGMAFKEFGILNYGVGDLFNWFTNILSSEKLNVIYKEFLDIQREVIDESISEDILRTIYHELVPKQIRHTIGAYYTPEWLAEYTLDTLCELSNSENIWNKRFLDPTCGSGTFLLATLNKVYKSSILNGISETEVLTVSIKNIVGYDINPIAVLAAKTNYLFYIVKLLSKGAKLPEEGISLPIYLCDSILPPQYQEKNILGEGGGIVVRLGNGTYQIPEGLVHSDQWDCFVSKITSYINNNDGVDKWFEDISTLYDSACNYKKDLKSLYLFIESNKKIDSNGFYTNLLLNAPIPLFEEKFDYIIGNPPWVNWEYLHPDYRKRIQHLWSDLGLFDLKGTDRANSKEDISALVTYVSCSNYLKSNGYLGFVIPQSLFKSSLNARGFRRFQIESEGTLLSCLQVDDLVDINPFEGVTNRTAVIFLHRDTPTIYPVKYNVWHLKEGKSIPEYLKWKQVKTRIDISGHHALPIDLKDKGSHWITGEPLAIRCLNRLQGKCPYKARTGVFTGGANGVFYLELIRRLENGNIIVRNITERAKREVDSIEAEIEPLFVYPLLRGREVDKWLYSGNSYILCPHTVETKMKAIDPKTLMSLAPLTYKYLEKFIEPLKERKGFVGWERQYLEEAFYACQRIGTYTFAPYKVVWRYICSDFRCSVIEPGQFNQPIFPHEKLMMLGFDEPQEAYYVCGILSSSPIRYYIESHMVNTQIAPHVISTLQLPKFDLANRIHLEIAKACLSGHNARKIGAEYQEYIDYIDSVMPVISPLDSEDISTIRNALSKL